MALSKAEKEALAEHYRGADLYDPSKAPEQEVYTFKPKSEPVKMYDAGEVAGDFDGPGISGDTTTAMGAEPDSGPMVFDAPGLKDALVNKVNPPAMAPKPPTMAQAESLPAKAPSINPADLQAAGAAQSQEYPKEESPAQSPVKSLQPDEYSQLVEALSARPSLGQFAMSGLAGLADAISTGVARTGSPGFQRNIMEQQRGQKEQLIAALTAKYGHNLELAKMKQAADIAANELTGQNTRAKNAQEGETARSKAEIASRESLAKTEREFQKTKEQRETAQKEEDQDQQIIKDYGRFKMGGFTSEQRDAAAARIAARHAGAANKPIYSTPQAQEIKQQYKQGKITKQQANEMLNRLK
jgi:hypothetical protein